MDISSLYYCCTNFNLNERDTIRYHLLITRAPAAITLSPLSILLSLVALLAFSAARHAYFAVALIPVDQ
jgi:hypothetical protein